MALHRKGNVVHYRIGVLEHVLVGFHIGELRQFAFAHIRCGCCDGIATYWTLVYDYGSPAVLVLNLAILDAAQGVEELLRDGAWLLAEGVALAGIEVVNIRDR